MVIDLCVLEAQAKIAVGCCKGAMDLFTEPSQQ